MTRTKECPDCQNFSTMKTNIGWIKTDYKVQKALGFFMLLLTLSAIFGWLAHLAKLEQGFNWALLSICLAILLLAPLGAWQVLSGLIYALGGDKLQQIYLAVVGFYFVAWSFAVSVKSDLFYVLFAVAFVIAVWKYTVVRADYISLKIIDVPKVEIEDLLDA